MYIKVQLLDYENYFGKTDYMHRIPVNTFEDFS